MTVYFCNAEPLDLLAIEIMGLSVKTGDSAIGFFGTGLKFAIATLLRHGADVSIIINGKPHFMTFERKSMRGQDFNQVIMVMPDGSRRALGFGTDLGKQWELWMAYRELHSNALDEEGTVTRELTPALRASGTIIQVISHLFDEVYEGRDKIFLSKTLTRLVVTESAEIIKRPNPIVYYRGVSAHLSPKPTLATYNIKSKMTLTEDRTLAHPWGAQTFAAQAAQQLRDEELLEKILLAEAPYWEQEFAFNHWYDTSEEFLETVKRLRRNVKLNQSALKVWLEKNPESEIEDDLALTSAQEKTMVEAFEMIRPLGIKMTRKDFSVARGLGDGIMGVCKAGKIIIALSTFDMGTVMLAGTLAEEWWHKYEGLRDCSRGFQNFLINKLITLANGLSIDPTDWDELETSPSVEPIGPAEIPGLEVPF